MTTHCDDLIPLILRAVDGTLPETDQAQLDAHLRTCTACAEALADQQAMRTSLAALAAEVPVTHAATRVLAQLRAEANTKAQDVWLDVLDWRRWTWRLVPVAAALALAVAAVSRPAVVSETTDTATDASATSTMPASSALLTDTVTGADLLSLLLNANADEAVVAVAATTDAGGR